MKITIDRNGDDVHVTVEREPMPESRFKSLCGLAGGVLYVFLVWVVGTLCSFPGVAVVGVLTLLIVMVASMGI